MSKHSHFYEITIDRKKKYTICIGERSSGRKHAIYEYLRKLNWSCRNVLDNKWYKELYGNKEEN